MASATTCLVCSCDDTQPIEDERLKDSLDKSTRTHMALDSSARLLCRRDIGRFDKALQESDQLIVACEQEAATFEAFAESRGFEGSITFVDIRDSAGWSDQAAAATPKMAALIAAARQVAEPPPALTITSEGACVVYGPGHIALEAATQIADRLDVTVIMTSDQDSILPPHRRNLAILQGRIMSVQGGFGGFRLSLDGAARLRVQARDSLEYERVDAELSADILIDLSGGIPLVQAPAKHDGYLKADPSDPASIQKVLFEAVDLVGEFDKPRYIDFTADLCAHSRSRRTGCTRCLDACPTSAIRPNGDHVAIDPVICAGCGSCASLCPTGAASYQAPKAADLGRKMRTLLSAYLQSGGEAPILLVTNDRQGRPLISALARYGHGLPARVLPLITDSIGQFGLDSMLAAMAFGASRLVLLAGRDFADDATPLETSMDYANTILAGLGYGEDRVQLLIEDDPDQLRDQLDDWLASSQPSLVSDFLPVGGKRDRLRLGLEAVHRTAPLPVEQIAMPEGAPVGTVNIDADGCTLCFACVSACPTGALIDNPDKPMLRFIEDACVQCGLCQNTCPEKVITLEPRVNFDPAAKSPYLIKEEEPFECVRCGKAFGTKSSIERIVEKLGGSHWMFQQSDQIERIKMCDDCRVKAQFERKDDPFRTGERPKTKTTEDYLREREEIEQARRNLKNGGDPA